MQELIRPMKKILLTFSLLFFVHLLSAQCPPAGAPIPGNTCPEAPLFCDNLDGYCTTINNNNTPAGFPGCPANALNNDEWISFIAASTTINLQITISNCGGGGGPAGLQAAIYDGCGGPTMATQCNCATTSFNLNSNAYVPGNVYYLVVDGCAGDICDYQINIIEGSVQGIEPETPGPIDGAVDACPGAFVPYFITPTANTAEYIWTITPPLGNVIGATDQNLLSVMWNVPGIAQLCVQTANACDTNLILSCTTINIQPIPPTTEILEACVGTSTICAGQSFSNPGTYNVNLTSWLGCDSLVTCIITPIIVPPEILPATTLCGPDLITICNQSISTSGIHTVPCTSYQGCDSTITVDLAILEPIANIAFPEVIGCGANSIVQLDGSGSNFALVPNGNTSFLWTGPGIIGDPTMVFIDVDMGGTYCLELTHERNGVACTDMVCIDVLEDTATPDPPFLSGLDVVCDGDVETYTVTFISGAVPIDYTWTTPNGEPILTIDPNTISVDWTGSAGGFLCVTANNDCGASLPECINITVNAAPLQPILSGAPNVCEGDDEIYQIGNFDPNNTYAWTVPTGASFNDLGNGSISVNFGGAVSGDVCVTANNDCGDSPETCFPVNVNNAPPAPTFTSGNTELCDSDVETFCVLDLPEADDYTWTSPAGTITGGSCQSIDWTGVTSGQVCVTANNNCGPSEITCIDVNVNPAPTATLSGTGSFCEDSGNAVDLSIVLTGTGPWTVDYTINGLAQFPLDISTSPFTLSATNAGSYELTGVNDQTGCPGIANGQVDVIEDPLPTASISGSGAICQGSATTVDLTITLTGTPNWTVNWAVDGAAQAALDISASPFTLTIGSAQAGDITIIDVTDGNGCFNTGDGSTATVVINDAPIVNNIQATCNLTNTGFVVTFEITGGDSGSYTVTGGAGSISATAPFIFTSDEIPSGDGYAFTVDDVNNCNPVLVDDVSVLCDCTTEVGAMDQNTVQECGDGPVTAGYDDAHVFDADDVVNFILHEGSGLSIVNAITTNDIEPTFGFVPPMTYGTVYYISAVVGNDLGNNTVDLTDPCLAVAQGTPVQFFEIPTAEISGTDSICVGDQGSLIVNFTGVAPWNIEYDDGSGTPVAVNGITANPFTLNVNPNNTFDFSLVSVTDNNCPGTISGAGTVVVHTGVQVSNVQTTCNITNTAFVVTFEITAGDETSYSVTGTNGTISATAPFIFTSEEITSGQGFDLIVSDINDCDPQNVAQTTVLCDCSTEVGTMDVTAEDICGEGPFLATYDPLGGNGENLDGDDILQYVLHTSATDNLGTILQTNLVDPTFGFLAPMEYGTTYYISTIIGSDDGNGSIDLNDPCLAVAVGTPITFFEIPTAFISGDASICESDNTNLVIDLTGESPWTVIINGETVSDINSNPYMHPVTPNANTNYTISDLSDANCPGTFDGEAVIMVNNPPSASNIQITCNALSTAFTVSFDISGGDSNCYEVTGLPGDVVGNQFVSQEIPTGSGFQFFLDDCNACGPITVEQAQVICDCETQAGTMDAQPVDACGNNPAVGVYLGGDTLDPDDVLCYFLHEGDNNPIANNPNEPSFNFNPGTMNYGQTYFLCAAVGNDNGSGCVDFNDPCTDISNCTEVVFYQEPTAALSGEQDICVGETVDITFTLTGTAPWSISFEDATSGDIFTETNILTDQHTVTLSPVNTAVYNILDVSDANCPGTFIGSTLVNVHAQPIIADVAFSCNLDNTFYTVTFEILGGDETSYQVFPANAGTISATPPYIFTSNDIDVSSGYSFQVDDGNGCGPVLVEQASIQCECITDAGSLNISVLEVCETDAAVGIHNSDETLDGDDILLFVLHDAPGNILGNVVGFNSIPMFSYDPATMSLGTTYYICAVAGNDDGTGNLDLTDPCISVVCGIPVIFNALPTIDITDDATICNGESSIVTFNMTGVGPFNVEYIDDNGVTQNLMGVTDGATIFVNPSDDAFVSAISIEDTGTGCTNTSNDFVTIQVSQPVNSGTATQPAEFCQGESENVALNSLLTGADAGGTWTDASGNPVNPPIFSTAGQTDGVYTFTYTVVPDAPCPIESTDVEVIIHELPVADAGNDRELNCGVSEVNLGGPNTTGGNVTYSWSGPAPLPAVANPVATVSGDYTFTVTNNATGCSSTDEVRVDLVVNSLVPFLTISDVSCFGDTDGFIRIDSINGGSEPYLCSFNGGPFTPETDFANLSAGSYSIVCKDSKDCSVELEVFVVEPVELDVTLQGDFVNENNQIVLGDSVNITVQVNYPFDSLDVVTWTPNGIVPCVKCDDFYVTPFNNMTLSIMIEENGCTASDEIDINVLKSRPVFVPNAFSPNNDGINDRLNIFSGPSVINIKAFMVFNRWGESVYQQINFAPNDVSVGWDGMYRGEKMNPAVFTWFAEVEFVDGAIEIFEGDVMILR